MIATVDQENQYILQLITIKFNYSVCLTIKESFLSGQYLIF